MDLSIVAAATPRTGSGLVMQVLVRAGVKVIGEKFLPRHPRELNPHGFYETPPSDDPVLVPGTAQKVFKTNLIERPESCIVAITFRHPFEALYSYNAAGGWPNADRLYLGFLAQHLRMAKKAHRAGVIHFSEAQRSPTAYLDQLSEITGVNCRGLEDQVDPSLFRSRRECPSEVHPSARARCEEAYDRVMRFGVEANIDDLVDPRQIKRAERHGIGSELKRIIESKAEAIPCGECKQAILRLNHMNPDAVRRDRSEIAKAIVQRAQTKAVKWYQRWAANLAPGACQSMVEGWIDEAITAAVDFENRRASRP